MIFLQTILFIIAAPLFAGFVKLVKCRLQNRRGPSLLQPYRNLNKLLHKETVVAASASSIFYLAPYIVFSITVLCASVIPLLVVGSPSGIADVIVLVGLFALARFFLTLAGMDIGTAFGGMGSSREMLIASLAEPALLMAFFTLASIASSTNLNVIVGYLAQHQFMLQPSLIFAAFGFALVGISETGRIPVDNPATHLELTMTHKAMLLEYSGRHLALMEWAEQIKFMIYSVLFINLFCPWGIASNFSWGGILLSIFALIGKLGVLGFLLAVAETNLAKLRLFRAPYLLNLAFLLCLLGLLNHIILEIGT